MPLKRGSSQKVISQNIKEMVASGHSQPQAVAAALHNAKDHKAAHKAHGGAMEQLDSCPTCMSTGGEVGEGIGEIAGSSGPREEYSGNETPEEAQAKANRNNSMSDAQTASETKKRFESQSNYAKGGKVLSAEDRKHIASKNFAGPDRSYPIEDASHARNALSRVSQFGSPELKARVRAKVHSKYPDIGKSNGGEIMKMSPKQSRDPKALGAFLAKRKMMAKGGQVPALKENYEDMIHADPSNDSEFTEDMKSSDTSKGMRNKSAPIDARQEAKVKSDLLTSNQLLADGGIVNSDKEYHNELVEAMNNDLSNPHDDDDTVGLHQNYNEEMGSEPRYAKGGVVQKTLDEVAAHHKAGGNSKVATKILSKAKMPLNMKLPASSMMSEGGIANNEDEFLRESDSLEDTDSDPDNKDHYLNQGGMFNPSDPMGDEMEDKAQSLDESAQDEFAYQMGMADGPQSRVAKRGMQDGDSVNTGRMADMLAKGGLVNDEKKRKFMRAFALSKHLRNK